ncbi:PEP-CTERM sorting domain-containing protein [Paracoccus sp. MC1854]|uniref:PEP-CTERM sorting domain-containing protein n=1 Tax=Paracoccus sp. MC1854 TaxID=2760306 RepID=UPI00160400D7|nr:PEP-CTERM sorting domain-containing protein [Paracoccus sp. MC1854]
MAALAFVALPISAMAATVTFNSTALAPLHSSLGTNWTTPDGFINVKSTGGNIWLGATSLGVAGSGQAVQLYQQLNNNESLRFTFASPVTNVTFSRPAGIFPVSVFSYDASGNQVFSASATYPNSLLPRLNYGVNGADNTPILSFLLQGVTGTSTGISSISYEPVAIAPVPVPAAGFLLLGALGMLALRRRKAA